VSLGAEGREQERAEGEEAAEDGPRGHACDVK
jgi:hypothetical protein